MSLLASHLIAALLFIAQPVQRVAVMDIQNNSQDESFNWVRSALVPRMRLILTDLGGFTVVERQALNRVRNESRSTRTADYDAAERIAFGKLSGADTLVFGEFTKVGNLIVLSSRFVDVTTGTIRAEASVEARYSSARDIYDLQNELALRLFDALKISLQSDGRRKLQAIPFVANVEALRAVDAGIFFHAQGLFAQALPLFDQALKLEPGYGEAHYYQGSTLAKLERWDEAIAALNRAAPIAPKENRVKWSWKAPFTADRSRRAAFNIVDRSAFNLQAEMLRRNLLSGLNRKLVYGEHTGNTTNLYMVDFSRRDVKPVTLASDKIDLRSAVVAGGLQLFSSELDPVRLQTGANLELFAVAGEAPALQWRYEVKGVTQQAPFIGGVPGGVYMYFPGPKIFAVIDAKTTAARWQRDDLSISSLEFPSVRGELLIVKSADAVHAIRLKDGADAWPPIRPRSVPFSTIVDAERIVVLEHNRAVSIVDVKTGKPVAEFPGRQAARDFPLGSLGSHALASAGVVDGILYFQGKGMDLYAVELVTGERLWQTPLKKRLISLKGSRGRLYGATEQGDVLLLEARTGALSASVPLGQKELSIDHAGEGGVVATSVKEVFGLDPVTGRKIWQVAAPFPSHELAFVNGSVVTRLSETTVAALDPATGAVRWQHKGAGKVEFYPFEDRLFVADADTVTEYSMDLAAEVTDREVLTELAHAYLGKGDWRQASTIAERVYGAVDANYPPLRLLRSRVESAKGNASAAARELAVYVELVGADSKAGKQALSWLVERGELLWYAELEADAFIGSPVPVGNRLLSVGRSARPEGSVVALNPADGKTLWRQPTERFAEVAADPRTQRAWYVTGETADPNAAVVYALEMESGLRREIARFKRPGAVDGGSVVFADERLLVLTASVEPVTRKIQIVLECLTADGQPLWTRTPEPSSMPLGGIAVTGGRVAYSIGRDLWLLDAATGAVVGEHRETGVLTPAALEGSAIFFTTSANELVGYDVLRGGVTYRKALANPPSGLSGVVVRDKTIIIADSGSVYAMSAADSKVTWRIPAPKDQGFVGLIDTQENLWARRDDGTLLQLDRTNGKILSEVPLLWPTSGIHISGTVLYAFTATRGVYALRLGH